MAKNKNIVPIRHYEQLENEMDYNDFSYFNQTFVDSYPPSKKAENIIINDFKKKHKKLPIGCTQT